MKSSLPVVDDLVGAERTDELDVVGAADGRDMGAEVLGELHGRRAERAGRAVDDDPAPRPDIGLAQRRRAPGTAPSQTAAASSKLMPAGLRASAARSRHADVLGVRAEVARRLAEHLVADLELAHRRADGFDLAGQLDAERSPPRPAEPEDETPQEQVGAAERGYRSG